MIEEEAIDDVIDRPPTAGTETNMAQVIPTPVADAPGDRSFAPARFVSRQVSALRKTPMILILVLTFLLFCVLVENFTSAGNLANMARVFAPLLIVSIGITLVFLIGGIDLSIGSTVSLASVVCAFVMRETGSVAVGALAGVGTGL